MSSYSFYLNDAQIERYYKSKGYIVETFRVFVGNNFKSLSSKKLKEEYEIRDSLLNTKLVYTEEELPDLKMKVMDLLEYIKANKSHNFWWYTSKSVIHDGGVYSLSYLDRDEKVVGKYEMQHRFKKTVRDYINSLIKDRIEDNYY